MNKSLMPTLPQCSECGATLSASEQNGLCTRCLLALALPSGSTAAANPAPVAAEALDTAIIPVGAPPTPRADPPARQFGDYELLEEIARGGMGVVYKARQRSLDRLVAVKMILAGAAASKEFIHRFRTEAAAAANLQHPNIVAVHEVGAHQGENFLVMDFVDGPNLSHFVGQQPLPAHRAARYVKAIAEAIHYAHERGILHRDLKPSNVLIDSASDQPRVTDFGLAKRFGSDSQLSTHDSQLTLTGQVLGSPNFMAPEQASGAKGKMNRRTDVYGLGAILYHLLTARPPFQAESLPETLQQVAHTEPLSPRLLNPSVPRDLETICLKCLEKEPSRRYSTARELADEFGRFLRDEPIHARPVMRTERAWRWCRRKPAVASFAGATVLLLLVVAIGAPIAAFRINRHRAAAERNAQAEARERTRAEHSLYAAEMNLAQEALNEHNLGRAWQLLERWNPASRSSTNSEGRADRVTPRIDPDLRGWEWRDLRSRCVGDELATLTDLGSKHSDFVISLAFSPDGRSLASGSHDGTVKLFNVAERREYAKLTHSEAVRAVAFSPRGPTLATLCRDNFIRLWDMETRLIVAKIPAHTTSFGSAMAFSTDGSMLAYCDPASGWLTVTNFLTNSSLRVEAYTDGYITRLAFSPDGRTLARRDWGKQIKFFDLSSGQERQSAPHIFWGNCTIAFSPDGAKLVSTSPDRTAKIWERSTGRLLRTFTHPLSFPCAALFLADGKTLAIANAVHTITLWDSETGEERATLKGHRGDILALALSPDGALLASGGVDGDIKVWSAIPRAEQNRSLRFTREAYRTAFAFSPSGETFTALRVDFDVEIWDSAALTRSKTLRLDHSIIVALALSSDGKRIASASGGANRTNRSVKIWRLDTSPPREEHRLTPEVGPIKSLEFSADGKTLAVAGSSIELWQVDQGKHAHSLLFEDSLKLAFSPSGDLVAAVGVRRNVKLWSVASGKLKWETTAHSREAGGLAFFPDGRTLVTGSADRTAKLWDVESGRHLATLEGLFQGADSVAVSPDGRRVAVGSGEGTVRIWKVDGPEPQEVALLRCLGSLANPISFLPGGNTIVARSFGGVQLWHAPSFAEIKENEQRSRGTR